jgi:acetyltransferase EpsM
MKKIIIFGCGGHAKIVFDCIKLMKNYRSIGFMDNQDYNSELSRKIKYLGSIEDFNNVIKGHDLKELLGVVAIGSNFIRRKVVQVIAKINNRFKWMNIIHPSAIVSNSAKIGSGNMILAGSIVCSDTIINNHVSINTGTCIDHDNIFSNFSSTGPAVVTGGNVRIGELSFLGIGSTVKHNVTIGKNTIVGGQSFVCNNCESNSLYYGVPAKKIKKRSEQEKYL